MNIEEINKIIIDEQPDRFLLATYKQRNRELITAFAFDGGEFEDKLFLVTFIQTVIFHIPSILHQPVIFQTTHHSNAKNYIPSISFDEEEFGENGFKIFLLLDLSKKETGYYIAAESITYEWISRQEGKNKWNIW